MSSPLPSWTVDRRVTVRFSDDICFQGGRDRERCQRQKSSGGQRNSGSDRESDHESKGGIEGFVQPAEQERSGQERYLGVEVKPPEGSASLIPSLIG